MSKENLTRAQVRERYLALEKKGLFDQHVDPIDMSIVIPVTKEYHYYPTSFVEGLQRRLRYAFVVRPFMSQVNGRFLETTVVGKGNLRGLKSAMIICNHIHMFDCLALKKAMADEKVRLIRDGLVVYDGKLASLKRFKDDVKEVKQGYECGFAIANYNDIKEGDIVEGYEIVEKK